MSGPWEDFAPTATATSAGPWQDFKAGGGSGGPWEDFKSNAQSLGKTPEAPYVDQLLQGFQRGKQFVAPLANIPDMVASKAHDLLGLPPVTPEGAAGVLSAMKHNLDIAGGGNVDKLYTQMTGHQPNPYLRYAPPVIGPEASQAAKHFVGRGISEFATPENALLAAATGGMEPAAMKILGLLFGVPQLKQAYEEARQGDVEGALLHGGVGAVATVAGARPEPKAPPLLTPGENLHVSGRLEPTYREGEIPVVGVRPVDIQQQVVVPPGFDIESPKPEGLGGSQLTYGKMGGKVEKQPGQRYSGVEIPNDFNRYKELTDFARAAIARGQMPEQNVLAEIEAIKNRQPIRGMPPVEPTQKQATKADLKPAVEVNGKLLVGNVGDTHADILTRNGINPNLYPHESSARGFTTDGQTLINRQQAATIAGEAGTAKAGGLDSQDLQPGGNVNAIRELRTDELSKTQPPGDLQKVGEEVREGAGAQAQGEAPQRDAQEGREGVQGVGSEGTFFSGMPLRLAKDRPKGKLEAFWMHFAGHLLPETEDYQLAREVARGEEAKTPAKGQVEDSSAKSLEQDMQAKGFAKVIRQGDTYFVDENASRTQMAGIRNQAKSEGREVIPMKLYSGLPAQDLGEFAMVARRLLRDPLKLRFNMGKEGEVDGGQLVNRLMNMVPPEEGKVLEGAGIKERFPAGVKTTAAEVDKWVGENSPRVEIKAFGEGGQLPEVKEFNDLTHNWYDRLPPDERGVVDLLQRGDGLSKEGKETASKLDQAKLNRYIELAHDPRAEGGNAAHWQSISPKPESEMPGYVEGAVTIPHEYKGGYGIRDKNNEQFGQYPDHETAAAEAERLGEEYPHLAPFKTTYGDAEKIFPHFPSSHSFPPNTLGFFRGYMETRPDGGKTFHVVEVQSDWAQKVRDRAEAQRQAEARSDPVGQAFARFRKEKVLDLEHPLLKDWERLTLKAAIEHARKEGADRIAVSDAETAMMTEGHDRVARHDFQHGHIQDVNEPSQAKGMRLHYDKILPKLLSELTGEKGTKAEFGPHKMAVEPQDLSASRNFKTETEARSYAGPTGFVTKVGSEWEGIPSNPRKDLIFKTPTGEPKTSVSATEFPLEKISKARETAPFTMFGKDKNVNLYSGINPFDPELLTKVLDRFYGHGVQRSPVERLKHFEAKQSGWSAPHHVIASEDTGNALVRYASADIFAKEVGLRPGFAKLYKERALQDLVNIGIKDGVYEYAPKGGGPGTIKGPVESFPVSIPGVGHKSLRVRADLAEEFEMAMKGSGKVRKAGAQLLVDLLTELQIMGTTDFVFHTGNMYSSIVKSPGKVGNYAVDQLLRMPVVKQVDAIGRIGYNIYKTMSDDPAVKAELANLARIGALRGVEERQSLIARATGGIVDTGKWIRIIDRAGRRARNQMFDNLVEQKILTDTELDRREFVNKMGQYNEKLMSKMQAFFRNYTSQFVVAGRTFNRNAMQSILASNEFRAANPSAYAKAKFSNMLALTSTAIVLPVVLNSIITGKPFGRAGTPVGKIDTGKDDEQGRPITIDPMKTDVSRRGARNLGIEAVVEGVKAEREPGDIAARAVKDIALGVMHPWMGPPVRFGEALTGTYKATGNATESIKEAIRAINPIVYGSLFGYLEQEGKGGAKALGTQAAKQLGEAYGVGSGRILSNIEKVEKQSGKPADQMSLRQRVLTERQVKEDRPPITKAEQAKSAVRAIENEQKRGDVIKSQLDKPTKAFLESRQLDLPGYDNKLEYNKTKVYLTNNENKRLDALVKEEYLKTINMLKSSDRLKQFDSGTVQQRQQVFDHLMTEAARRAKLRLGKELYEKVPDESNAQTLGKTKRKRYSIFGQ